MVGTPTSFAASRNVSRISQLRRCGSTRHSPSGFSGGGAVTNAWSTTKDKTNVFQHGMLTAQLLRTRSSKSTHDSGTLLHSLRHRRRWNLVASSRTPANNSPTCRRLVAPTSNSTTRRPFLSTACVRHRYLAPAVVFKMSLWKSFAKMYKANVSRTLRGYGLRLEDIYNEAHPEYYQVCWEFH